LRILNKAGASVGFTEPGRSPSATKMMTFGRRVESAADRSNEEEPMADAAMKNESAVRHLIAATIGD
jgi:hypothetical protein